MIINMFYKFNIFLYKKKIYKTYKQIKLNLIKIIYI